MQVYVHVCLLLEASLSSQKCYRLLAVKWTRVKIWSCFTSLVSIKDKCLSHFLMLKVEGGSIYPRLCQVQTNILFYALERHVHPTLILPLLVQKERFCETSQYHLVEGKLVYLHHSWDSMSDELILVNWIKILKDILTWYMMIIT